MRLVRGVLDEEKEQNSLTSTALNLNTSVIQLLSSILDIFLPFFFPNGWQLDMNKMFTLVLEAVVAGVLVC